MLQRILDNMSDKLFTALSAIFVGSILAVPFGIAIVVIRIILSGSIADILSGIVFGIGAVIVSVVSYFWYWGWTEGISNWW